MSGARFKVPQYARRGACSSCGRPVAFVRTAADREMPVDLETLRDEPADLFGRTVQTAVSHFATCPRADEHRRAER